MKIKINDIYNYAVSNNLPLFGDTSGFDFMAEYSANNETFDYFYNKRFSSFLFFSEFPQSVDGQTVYNDFVRGIRAFLMFNKKRFSELYRVHVLAADAYDIVNNYDLTETSTRTNSGSGSVNRGARSDSDTFGSHTDSDTYGTREDSTEVTNGQQKTTTERDVAGFNSSDYSNADKEQTTANSYSNSGTATKGAQTDSHTIGAQSNSHTIGAQTETSTNTGSESLSLRRFGNIGVQTAAEIIGGHIRLWESFSFYEILFSEIAKEFLLLDDDFTTGGSDSVFSENDVAEILAGINQLRTQLTASTNTITGDIEDVRIDITDVREDVHDAESNILNAIQLQTNQLTASALEIKVDISDLKTSVLAAESRIKSNDNTNTANILADITGVVTNGY